MVFSDAFSVEIYHGMVMVLVEQLQLLRILERNRKLLALPQIPFSVSVLIVSSPVDLSRYIESDKYRNTQG